MLRKRIIYTRHLAIIFIGMRIAATFSSCKKTDVLPGNTPDVAINYYNASDVIQVMNRPVNITLSGDAYSQLHTSAFVPENNWKVYPKTDQYLDQMQVNYSRYQARTYRFAFTDSLSALFESGADLQAGKYYCLYLADATAEQHAAPVYRLLAVNETRNAVPEGQTGVRFIHLSPDAGSLQAALVRPNGNEGNPFTEIALMQTSEYTFFNAENAANGLLHFRLSNAANNVTLPVGVPFTSGKSYAVVIQGFTTEQTRQVPDAQGAGTINITIPSNLRADVRRTY